MNKPKSIIVEIPILDSIDEMKVINTFTEEQLWYVCAIAKAFEKTQSNWNSLRNFLESMIRIYENEYKDVDTAYHYRCSLDKMNELEGKDNN